jgi:hypothetical protein
MIFYTVLPEYLKNKYIGLVRKRCLVAPWAQMPVRMSCALSEKKKVYFSNVFLENIFWVLGHDICCCSWLVQAAEKKRFRFKLTQRMVYTVQTQTKFDLTWGCQNKTQIKSHRNPLSSFGNEAHSKLNIYSSELHVLFRARSYFIWKYRFVAWKDVEVYFPKRTVSLIHVGT